MSDVPPESVGGSNTDNDILRNVKIELSKQAKVGKYPAISGTVNEDGRKAFPEKPVLNKSSKKPRKEFTLPDQGLADHGAEASDEKQIIASMSDNPSAGPEIVEVARSGSKSRKRCLKSEAQVKDELVRGFQEAGFQVKKKRISTMKIQSISENPSELADKPAAAMEVKKFRLKKTHTVEDHLRDQTIASNAVSSTTGAAERSLRTKKDKDMRAAQQSNGTEVLSIHADSPLSTSAADNDASNSSAVVKAKRSRRGKARVTSSISDAISSPPTLSADSAASLPSAIAKVKRSRQGKAQPGDSAPTSDAAVSAMSEAVQATKSRKKRQLADAHTDPIEQEIAEQDTTIPIKGHNKPRNRRKKALPQPADGDDAAAAETETESRAAAWRRRLQERTLIERTHLSRWAAAAAAAAALPHAASPHPPPPPPPPRRLKIITWNVTTLRGLLSLRAELLARLVEAEEPDLLCMQETRLNEEDRDEYEARLRGLLPGCVCHWSFCRRPDFKSYSGTVAIELRRPPPASCNEAATAPGAGRRPEGNAGAAGITDVGAAAPAATEAAGGDEGLGSARRSGPPVSASAASRLKTDAGAAPQLESPFAPRGGHDRPSARPTAAESAQGLSGTDASESHSVPVRVTTGLPTLTAADGDVAAVVAAEGRVITVEFADLFVVACYVPNSGAELRRLDFRTRVWDRRLREYLVALETDGGAALLPAAAGDDPAAGSGVDNPERGAASVGNGAASDGGDGVEAMGANCSGGGGGSGSGRCRRGKPVVLCGDLNVAHLDGDIWNPTAPHIPKSACTTPAERSAFGELLGAGFVDAFRRLHPAAVGWFSFWSLRASNFPVNRGLRLDYFVTSPSLYEELPAEVAAAAPLRPNGGGDAGIGVDPVQDTAENADAGGVESVAEGRRGHRSRGQDGAVRDEPAVNCGRNDGGGGQRSRPAVKDVAILTDFVAIDHCPVALTLVWD